MYFAVNVTQPATTPTATQDTLLQFIKSIALNLGSNQYKFSVDAAKWFFVEKTEKGTAPANDLVLPGASTSKTLYVQLNADFAINNKDDTDIRALLATKSLTTLRLEVTWGAAADLASANAPTVNVGSTQSYCQVELRTAFDDQKPDDFNDKSNFIDIRESVGQYTYGQAYSSYDTSVFEQSITPTGALLLTSLLLCRDNVTTQRSDSKVTAIKVEDTKGQGYKYLQRAYTLIHNGYKAEYSLESIDTGIVYIDWVDELGVGLPNYDPQGTLKWRFLTNAPSSGNDIIEYFTRYSLGKPAKAK
jgi:hypothetical protein